MENIEQVEGMINGISEEDINTYLGKNSSYYLKRWQEKINLASGISWNWAGLFLNIFWLGYRKLYKQVIYIFCIFLAFDLFSYLRDGIGHSAIIDLSVIVAIGLYGNVWYFKSTMSKIDKIKSDSDNIESLELRLKKNGGTSWKGVGIAFLLFALYIILTIIMEEIVIYLK